MLLSNRMIGAGNRGAVYSVCRLSDRCRQKAEGEGQGGWVGYCGGGVRYCALFLLCLHILSFRGWVGIVGVVGGISQDFAPFFFYVYLS